MGKVSRKSCGAGAERALLTAADVERLSQIATGEIDGDEAVAREALVRAVEDRTNFREPWVYAAAARIARHFNNAIA